MPELPSGTLTLLFTDVEGSTRLVQEHGEGYAELLNEHRRRLRAAFAQYGGVEVDTQGDSFFVVFPRAADAVAASLAAQEALGEGPIRVRMGIHTGEPVTTTEGYVGADVHVAARIMGAGHGRQVLLSDATRRLLADGTVVRDLGEHRLKDLGAPRRLYQLGDANFPPLRTLYRTNLPIQPTAIVGRELELREAGDLLRRHRLVTLIGPGGSGKTRLALQLAADSVEDFPDGVFWVPLMALREPAHVERAIATAIGADENLVDYIGSQRLLLLADNFEQVIEAASTISTLLAGTPNAKVIVTSREPLHLDSEQRYPVEPLPDEDAVALFTERASAAMHGFTPNPAVAAICRRLDGLPLAIELAAARVALLDPEELLARLDRRLPLLASRSRDAPARQRTLHATIEWSHDLLGPQEQLLFRKLAVFRGTFTVHAAEAVCDADVDALESLVVKSLLRRFGAGRLGMLDTIREYGLERLDASPDADEVRRRHAEYFLSVAKEANLNPGRLGPGGQRLDIALPEIDNFRSALAWALSSESVALAMEIAVALDQLWTLDDLDEAIQLFERILDQAPVLVSKSLYAEALRACGSYHFLAGRHAIGEEMWVRSLAIYEDLDDDQGRAVMLHRLGISAIARGDLKQARELVERSDELHRGADDVFGRAQTTGTLGAINRDEGNVEAAIALVRQSADLARQASVPWWESGALAELACLSIAAGLLDDAEGYARTSLAMAETMRDRPGRVFGVAILARIAAERGHGERAGKLWAVVETAEHGAPLGGWTRHQAEFEARIRDLAGADFERGYAAGKALTLDEAVALAKE